MIRRVEVTNSEIANAVAETGSAEFRWPALRRAHTFDDFGEGGRTVRPGETPAA